MATQKRSTPTFVLYATLLLIGFILGVWFMRIQRIAESSQSVSFAPSVFPTPVKTAGEVVVQGYYTWYFACINRHFATLGNHTPQEDCPYGHNGVLTGDLIQRLQQNTGSDPILCAQNTPIKLTYEPAIVNPSGTQEIVVHTHWGASPVQNIYVWTKEIGSTWNIFDISCN